MNPRAVPCGRSLLADTNRWRWQDSAGCRGQDLDLFYGPPHERAEARQVREEKALAVCAACLPATRAVCLEAALVPGPTGQHGVQGGHTADERIRIRRDRMRKTARRAA